MTLLLHPFPCTPILSSWLNFFGVRGRRVLVPLNFPHHWEHPMVMALSPAQPQDQPCLPHPPASPWQRNTPKWSDCGGRVEFTPVCCSAIPCNWGATHNINIPTKSMLSAVAPVGSPALLTAPVPKHPLCCSEGAGTGGCSALARERKADISM